MSELHLKSGSDLCTTHWIAVSTEQLERVLFWHGGRGRTGGQVRPPSQGRATPDMPPAEEVEGSPVTLEEAAVQHIILPTPLSAARNGVGIAEVCLQLCSCTCQAFSSACPNSCNAPL